MVGVFDLGLGQGGFACGAPVDGFLALVDVPREEELAELRHRDRLVFVVHRQVRIFPFPESAQSLELPPLNIHEPLRVNAAGAALVRLGQALLPLPEFLVHLMLDRKPVAVPAGNVEAIQTGHVLGLDDHVLDDLVHGRSQVDIAVGVGGAVMEDIDGAPLRGLANLVVDPHLLPAPEHVRLFLGKIGLHGKRGLREIQRILVVHGALLHRGLAL